MVVLAVVLAQILDPFRVIFLAAIFALSRLADNRGAGYFSLVIGAIVLAFVFPFVFLDQSGTQAYESALMGILANTVILAVVAGVLRLIRR